MGTSFPTDAPAAAGQDHDAPASPSLWPTLPEPARTPAGPGDPGGAGDSPTDGPAAEPHDVGPVAGGSLRASDADRDQVAALLSAAYAEGRLTRDEHDERLGRVLGARTFDDLVPLTADLVPLGPAPATVSSPAPAYEVGSGGTGEPDRMVAVFGGVERHGRWRVRARSQVTAIFGGVDLDLREVDFDAPVVEITVQTCFGGVDLKVPAGVTIRNETVTIFGGTEVKNLGEPVEGAPTIVIKGTVLFGGVTVKGPRPKLFGRGHARPGLAALDPRPSRMQHRHGGREG